MSNNEQFDKVINTFRNLTRKQCIDIKVIENSNPNITDSKFGGLPYLPQDVHCPTTPEGEQLHFLAQYRLDEIPKNDIGLPTTGLLQFWVLMDEMIGLNDDNYILNDRHRVIYYPKIDMTVTRDGVSEKYRYPEDEYANPVRGEYAITFQLGENMMSYEDRDFQKVTSQIDGFENLSEADDDKLYEAVNQEGHLIGGNPVFPQYDIRDSRYIEFNKHNLDYSNYDILLLQIDSERNDATGDLITWGDCGNAHFFITKDDLAQLDFSNVMYEWNCY
ncbi:YwqG family protein [Macrococcus armenti]|uniref:YwqG family protein n=1 Tax=Macrococcus armenti TaxID=2875764 RepID=A0ABY3ZVH8_9STAP|nr:YwqG family protein [Macrococcus armenti]UOB20905.1 YwqG family protein [Macrococcus armenti]